MGHYSAIGLAHAVGATCIADGVENPEQYATLAELQCDYAQGYLFSRPVPADDIRSAIRHCTEALATNAGLPVQRTVL